MNLMKHKWMSAYAVMVGLLMSGCLIVDEHEDDVNNDAYVHYDRHSNPPHPGDGYTGTSTSGSNTSNTSTSGSNTSNTSTSGSNTSNTSTSGSNAPLPCADPDAVCGQDGVTYESSCEASRKKVRVAHKGACPVACIEDAECAQGELCVQGGVCQAVACPVLAEDDISQEVCASDGFTYKSACDARQARLSIAHQGCCVD